MTTGYAIITPDEASFSRSPRNHVRNGTNAHGSNLFLEGDVWNRFSLSTKETRNINRKQKITRYLVMNVNEKDTSDPMETLKTYHDHFIDYMDYKYDLRTKETEQVDSNVNNEITVVQRPKTPDVIVIKIEKWMVNYINEKVVNLFRAAYRRDLLLDTDFNSKVVDMLMESKRIDIEQMFATSLQP